MKDIEYFTMLSVQKYISCFNGIILGKERSTTIISENNEIWIDKRQVDVRAVQANIERLYAENPQGSVVIQADEESNTRVLIKVMDAARSAGVYDVSVATDED